MNKPKRPDVEALAKGKPPKDPNYAQVIKGLAKHTLEIEATLKTKQTRLTELVKKLYTHTCKKTHAQIGWNADLKGTGSCMLCEEKARADQATAFEAALHMSATKVTSIDWANDDAPDQAHKIFMDALKTPKSQSLQELTTLVQAIVTAVRQSRVTEADTLGTIVDAVIPFAHLAEEK